MSADSGEVAQFRERLNQLERRCNGLRREAWVWRFGIVVAVTTAVAMGWNWHAPPTDAKFGTVSAGRFELKDEAGVNRASLVVLEKGEVGLFLKGSDGEAGASVIATNTGGLVSLFNKEGKIQAQMSLNESGPVIQVRDQTGVCLARLGVNDDGGILSVQSRKDQFQAVLGVSKESGVLNLGGVAPSIRGGIKGVSVEWHFLPFCAQSGGFGSC